jgi:hypothetical protein
MTGRVPRRQKQPLVTAVALATAVDLCSSAMARHLPSSRLALTIALLACASLLLLSPVVRADAAAADATGSVEIEEDSSMFADSDLVRIPH